MNEEVISQLHGSLKGLDSNFNRTLDEFKQDMQDDTARHQLWENLGKIDSGFTRSFDEFTNDLGVEKQLEEPEKSPSIWHTIGKSFVSAGSKVFQQLNALGDAIGPIANPYTVAADTDYAAHVNRQQSHTRDEKREAAKRVEEGTASEEDKALSAGVRYTSELNKEQQKYAAQARQRVGENATFTGLIKQGNIGGALELGMITAIESAPQMIMGMNVPGRIMLGSLAAADEFDRLTNERPNMSVKARVAQSIFVGALEQFFESKFNPLKLEGKFTKGTIKQMIRDFRKKGIKVVLEDLGNVFKSWGIDAAGEGLEEVLTTTSTDAVKYIIGAIDENGEGFNQLYNEAKAEAENEGKELTKGDYVKSIAIGIVNDFIGGAMAGGYMGSMSHGVQAVNTIKNDIEENNEWNKLTKEEQEARIADADLARSVVDEIAQETGKKRKEVLSILDEASEPGEIDVNKALLLDTFNKRLEEKRAQQEVAEETPAPAEPAATETLASAKPAKGKRETSHPVNVVIDGVEQTVTFSGTNVVYNEDGSIDHEHSGKVFLQDTNGNIIPGSQHDAVLEAIDNTLRTEKKNGEELEKQDQVDRPAAMEPVVPEPPVQVPETTEPPVDTRTPEQIAADEAAAAEQAEQQRIQDVSAALDQQLQEKGDKVMDSWTPEESFIYTMTHSSLKDAVADAQEAIETAKTDKNPTRRRKRTQEIQSVLDKYIPKVQENAGNINKNLHNSENISTFAQNSEDNDNRTIQPTGEGGNQSTQSERPAGVLDGNRTGTGNDNGGNTTGNNAVGVRSGFTAVDTLDSLNEEVDSKLRSKGIFFPDVRVVRVNAQDFHDAIETGRKKNPNGWRVDVKSVEELEHCYCMLTEGGTAGIAIKENGDIVSLFSSTVHPGISRKLLLMAIVNGGRKADFFMNPKEKRGLQNLYWRFGARITGQNPFSEEIGREYVNGWVEYHDLMCQLLGKEEGHKRALNHPTAAAIFPATIDEALDAFVERQGKMIEEETGLIDLGDGQQGLKGVPVFDDYDQMIEHRDAEMSKPVSEPVNLSDPDIVLTYQRSGSYYQFARKSDDGKLISLESGNVLDKSWKEKDKEVVYIDGKMYYTLGEHRNGNTVNVVPVETTMPVITVKKKDGESSVQKVDKGILMDEEGKLLHPKKNNRDPEYDALLKNAKSINELMDYAVYDDSHTDDNGNSKKDGRRITLRELLNIFSSLSNKNKRLYIGESKYLGKLDKLLLETGKTKEDFEEEVSIKLANAINIWNNIVTDSKDKVKTMPKDIHHRLRMLIKLIESKVSFDETGHKRIGDYFAGPVDESQRKEDTTENKKRPYTQADIDKRDRIQAQLRGETPDSKHLAKFEKDNLLREAYELESTVDFTTPAKKEEPKVEIKLGTKPKKGKQQKRPYTKEDEDKLQSIRARIQSDDITADEAQELQKQYNELLDTIDFTKPAATAEESAQGQKRKATEKDVQDLAGLKQELDEAIAANDEAEVEELRKEIDKLRKQVEFNVGNIEVNEEAGHRAVEYLQSKGVDITEISDEEAEQMIGDEKAEQLRNSKGVLYGLAVNGKVYVIGSKLNPNTPVHEYTHLWVNDFKKANQKKWAEIVKVLKQTQQWNDVITDENYANIKDNADAVASEVLARLSGDYWGQIDENGKSRLDEAIKDKALLVRVRSALRSLWKYVCSRLGKDVNLRDKDADAQLQEIIRKPIEDLMDGKKYESTDNTQEYQIVAEQGSTLTEEEQRIKSEAEARGDFMKAPDGTDTKLTEKQWCQVRTEAFKRWAGDWQNGQARIFMDENGEPKVLYHGTRHFGFRTFDIKNSLSAPGVFFAENEDVAKGYAGLMAKISHIGDTKKEVTTKDVLDVIFGEDIPLRNSLQLITSVADVDFVWEDNTVLITPRSTGNSFGIDLNSTSKEDARKIIEDNIDTDIIRSRVLDSRRDSGIYATFVRAENVLEIDADGSYWDEIPTSSIEGYPESETGYTDTNEIAQWAKDNGYDGVIIRNTYDSAGEDYGFFSGNEFDEYISLRDKGDIKSATDNNGEFDENNPDIEFQIGDPDPRNISEKVQEDMEKRKQKVQEKNENVHTKPAERLEGTAKLVYQLFDNTHGLLLLQGKINEWRKRHGKARIPDSMDVRSLLNRCSSAIASRVTLFDQRQGAKLQQVTEKIAEKIAKTNLMDRFREDLLEEEDSKGRKFHYKPNAKDLLERYLIARDNVERAEMGIPTRGEREFTERMGMSMAEYATLFQDQLTDEELKELWGVVRDCTHTSLQELLRGERISQEDYDTYMQRQFYVPEKDFAERETNEELQKDDDARKGGRNRQATAVAHKAEGGNSLATNILANIVHDAKNSIAVAQENLVRKAMYDLMNDNLDYTEEYGIPRPTQVWFVRTGTTENGEPIYERTTERPSQDMLDEAELIRTLIFQQQQRLHDEKDNPNRSAQIKAAIESLRNELPIVSAKQANDGRRLADTRDDVPSVKVYVNGVQYEMTFDGMQEVADALNGIYDLRGNDAPVRHANAVIASMFTTYNPTFFAVNLARDTPYILAKGYSQYGIEFVHKFGKALTVNGVDTRKPILQYLSGQLNEGTPEGRLFYNFLMGGGNTGYTQLMSIREIKEEFEKNGWGKTGIGKLFDIGARLNEYSELLTRFAAYKAVLECGYSENEALNAAKNLSVNFNRRGAGQKFLNYFNSLSMFSNAAIQGATGFFRAFDNSKNTSRAMFGLVFMPAFLGFMNTLLCPDDDDDEFVVSDFYRDNYCVIGSIKIPLPEQFRPFWAMGVNIAMGMQGRRNGGQIAKSLSQSFTQYLMPVPPAVSQAFMKAEGALAGEDTGLGDAADVVSTLMLPQFASGVQEIAHNKDFMGNTIRKYDLGAIPQYKLGENEAALYQDIAKFFYWANGGDTKVPSKYKKGSIDEEVGRWYIPLPANVNPKEVHKGLGTVIPAGWLNILCTIYGFTFSPALGDGVTTRAKDIPLVSTFYRPEDETMFRYTLYKEMKRITTDYDNIVKEVKKQYKGGDDETREAIEAEIKSKLVNASERGFNPVYWKQLEDAYKATSVYDIAHKLGKTEDELRKQYPELDNLEDFQKMIAQQMNEQLMEYHGIEHHIPWLQEKMRVWDRKK